MLMAFLGGRGITQRPESKPRILADSRPRRLHFCSAKAHTGREQSSNQRETGRGLHPGKAPWLPLIILPGSLLPNHLRHRGCPSGRSLPLTLLSSFFKSAHLLLLPNMGQPQPNLQQRPPAY